MITLQCFYGMGLLSVLLSIDPGIIRHHEG
jgi:hypothetical protein